MSIIKKVLVVTAFSSVALTAMAACKGDLNNDGVIDATDKKLMKNLQVGFSNGINKTNADMNGDGKITNVDLSQLNTIANGTRCGSSFKKFSGYAAKKYNVYTNSSLTRRNSYEWIDAGDYVTVLGQSGNAYLVEYPTSTGVKKQRYVSKSGFTISNSNSSGISVGKVVANLNNACYKTPKNGFPEGQCTWYAKGRYCEVTGKVLDFPLGSHAKYWGTKVKQGNSVSVDGNVSSKSIGIRQSGGGGYGHVIFIEQVNGNTVYYTDANNGVAAGKVRTMNKSKLLGDYKQFIH
ncbi:dockerin type I domain-containing protein [Oxalobacter aliiformigenes]|uniref:dockerin type I domain-containing protein n=1 Tax=Oxalobacter aliiformigenes TaxID=2946593 RepID=UPI0022AED3F9|nr:dockerin type I domain-containing protein [Oxalobacter aliiformigenes]MCZ4064381.1 dockerin type I domain-containing protein [Oxalobacter aliiformigenes]WAV99732.1 dockerin type I domain-containing protein [Oxalobacter aliiformigenes]